MVAAARGYQRPIGEWNFQEVTVEGLNGPRRAQRHGDSQRRPVEGDPATYMAGREHPGVDRTIGFFGFAGHNDPVMFRNIQIRKR